MSQYFLPTVIQTNFSDTKNVLTKKHQSNVQSYEDCLRISKNIKNCKKTPDEMADIIDKMRKKKLECQKTRPIQVLQSPPEERVNTENKKMCKAVTLSGKSCTFKAVCGNYCKKHKIDDQVLGIKPKINVSLL
jgi:hypothetical protein